MIPDALFAIGSRKKGIHPQAQAFVTLGQSL
jgi:hypothetical protein